MSYHFICVLDTTAEDGGEDHLDVFWEGVVMEGVDENGIQVACKN